MESPHPKISVIMPVYNGEKFLQASIESILHQTFTDFEFLIMDDGSTDRSLTIIEAYAKTDPRIRVFRQKNQGIVKSLNTLAGHAKADLLARMDADDISYPTRLKTQYEYMKARPDTVLLGTYAKIIETTGWRLNTAFEEDEINRWYLSVIPTYIHSSIVLQKKAFFSCGGYREDEYPAEDYGLGVRIKNFGKLRTAGTPDEPLVEYYLHPKSISSQNFKDQVAMRDTLNFKNLEDLFKKNQIPSAAYALKVLKKYRMNFHQRQILGKLACLTGCFYVEKKDYQKASEYFKLCLRMDFRRFDAAFDLILGKFRKAFLISLDKIPHQKKLLLKVYWFPRNPI